MLNNENVKDEIIENHEMQKTIDIKASLLTLPLSIKDAEIELMSFQKNVLDMQESIERQEVLVKADVSMETDADGKKKFKNEIERNAEVSKRLFESERFKEIKKELSGASKSLKLKEIELKFLYNEFSALKAIARMSNDDNNF